MPGDDRQGLLRIWQGEEMVEIDTVGHTPGEMLRHERRIEPGDEPVQARQMTVVQRVSAPERQSYPMHCEWVVGSESLQRSERGACAHVVLGMHLKPAESRTCCQQLRDMRRAQANPHT
jgi:hypothetical protein